MFHALCSRTCDAWRALRRLYRHPRYADAVLLPREVVSELEMEGDKPTLTSQESKEESTEDTQDSTDFDFHSLVICAVPVLGVLVLNAVPSPWRHFAIYAIFVFTAAKADKVGMFVSFVWEKLSTVGAGSKRPAQYLLIAYQNAVHLVLWLEPAVLELLEQIKSLTGCTSEKNARTAGAGAENGTGEPGATATRKETAATSETSKEAATPETSRQKARRFSMIMIEHTISVEKVEKRKETTLKDGEVSRRDRALVMRAKARCTRPRAPDQCAAVATKCSAMPRQWTVTRWRWTREIRQGCAALCSRSRRSGLSHSLSVGGWQFRFPPKPLISTPTLRSPSPPEWTLSAVTGWRYRKMLTDALEAKM
eukprot:2693917-Rhodomonas_salina.4